MDIEKVYEEIGTNYRYFLNWRYGILAGYFVTLSGLAVGLKWTLENDKFKSYSIVVFLIGLFLSLFFWSIDYRNRDLYRICQTTGAKIEETENIKNKQGMYSLLNISGQKNRITHSRAMNSLFAFMSLLFLIGTIIAVCRYCI